MQMRKPKFLEWMKPDVEFEERWDYRDIDKYPEDDASDDEIERFIKDAKEAEEALANDLESEGMSEYDARIKSCQWPIRDDAPMEIVRDFISFQREMLKAAEQGIDF